MERRKARKTSWMMRSIASLLVMAMMITALPSTAMRSYAAPKEEGGVVTFDVTEYGADPTGGRDSAPAVYAAIEAAKKYQEEYKGENNGKNIAVKINFPQGRYDFYPDRIKSSRFYCTNTLNFNDGRGTQGDFDGGNENELATFNDKYYGILIDGMEDVTVEGNDSMFMYHGNMGTFASAYSKNVTFQNFDTDFQSPWTFDTTIVSVDYDKNQAVVKIPECYTYRINGTRILLTSDVSPYNGKPYFKDQDVLSRSNQVKRLDVTNNIWTSADLYLNNVQSLTDNKDHTVTIQYNGSGIPSGVKAGLTYQSRDTKRRVPVNFLWRSENVTVEDVAYYYCHGFGIVAQHTKDLTLKDLTFGPPKETGRTSGGFADFMQIMGCSGNVIVDGCMFQNPQDDPINLHGTYNSVTQINQDRDEVTVKFRHHETFGYPNFTVGDVVEFCGGDGGVMPYGKDGRQTVSSEEENIFRATVLEYTGPNGRGQKVKWYKESGSDEIKEIIVDEDISANQDALKTMVLKLDTALPADIPVNGSENGTRIENITDIPEKVEIARCTFKEEGPRGLLIKTRGEIDIHDNLFDGVQSFAIEVENATANWMESGRVLDMKIRNNTFTRGLGEGSSGENGHSYILIQENNGTTGIHKNITIEGNDFYMGDYGTSAQKGSLTKAITARRVKGLTIKDNNVYWLDPNISMSFNRTEKILHQGDIDLIDIRRNNSGSPQPSETVLNISGKSSSNAVFEVSNCSDEVLSGNIYDEGMNARISGASGTANVSNDTAEKNANNQQLVGRKVIFVSDNTDVVKVSSDGVAYAEGPGTATVTAYIITEGRTGDNAVAAKKYVSSNSITYTVDEGQSNAPTSIMIQNDGDNTNENIEKATDSEGDPTVSYSATVNVPEGNTYEGNVTWAVRDALKNDVHVNAQSPDAVATFGTDQGEGNSHSNTLTAKGNGVVLAEASTANGRSNRKIASLQYGGYALNGFNYYNLDNADKVLINADETVSLKASSGDVYTSSNPKNMIYIPFKKLSGEGFSPLEEDWAIEVQVDGNTASQYQSVGMLVYADVNNYIMLRRQQRGSGASGASQTWIALVKEINGSGNENGPANRNLASHDKVIFRIEKIGNAENGVTIKGYFKYPTDAEFTYLEGKDWTSNDIIQNILSSNNLQVGLITGGSESVNPSPESTNIEYTFSNLKFINLSVEEVPDTLEKNSRAGMQSISNTANSTPSNASAFDTIENEAATEEVEGSDEIEVSETNIALVAKDAVEGEIEANEQLDDADFSDENIEEVEDEAEADRTEEKEEIIVIENPVVEEHLEQTNALVIQDSTTKPIPLTKELEPTPAATSISATLDSKTDIATAMVVYPEGKGESDFDRTLIRWATAEADIAEGKTAPVDYNIVHEESGVELKIDDPYFNGKYLFPLVVLIKDGMPSDVVWGKGIYVETIKDNSEEVKNAKSSNATLKAMHIKVGGVDITDELTRGKNTGFDRNEYGYNYRVNDSNADRRFEFSFVPEDSGATVEVLFRKEEMKQLRHSTDVYDGKDYKVYSDDGTRKLTNGANVLECKVIAEDGITTRTYRINVDRKGSNDARLKKLSINKEILIASVEGSDQTQFNYQATGAEGKVIIEAIGNSDAATVTISGPNGSADLYGNVTLEDGNNAIIVTVTPETGGTPIRYFVDVLYSKPGSTGIGSVSITDGKIKGDISRDVYEYEGYSTSALTNMSVRSLDPNATVFIQYEGETIAEGKGKALAPIVLKETANEEAENKNLVSVVIKSSISEESKIYTFDLELHNWIYLSDLPYTRGNGVMNSFPIIDANQGGGKLGLVQASTAEKKVPDTGVKLYDKGIVLHPSAQNTWADLTFNLANQPYEFTYFTADIGIASSVNRRGDGPTAEFKVVTDGTVQKIGDTSSDTHTASIHPNTGEYAGPKKINVAIEDVNNLTISIRREESNAAVHGAWADAKLYFKTDIANIEYQGLKGFDDSTPKSFPNGISLATIIERLPEFTDIITNKGIYQGIIEWHADNVNYNPTSAKEQNFIITGEVSVDQIGFSNVNKITDAVKIHVRVEAADNALDLVMDDIEDQIYTGKPIKPVVRISDRGVELGAKDYSVTYKNNVNTGTAQIIVKGKGNYKGEEVKEFIILPKDISEEDVVAPDLAALFNGNVQKLKPVISYEGKKLVLNKDYELSYNPSGNYIRAGKYDVKVVGKGNYTGERIVPISIVNGTLVSKLKIGKVVNENYTGEAICPKPTVYDGNTPLKLNEDYTLSYKNNKEVGTGSVIITGMMNPDTGKGYAGEKEIKFKILGVPINQAKVTVGSIPKSTPYTGDSIEPLPKLTYKDAELTINKDYTVSYQSQLKVGTATVLITGKGGYTGTMKQTFKITPLEVNADGQILIDNKVADNMSLVVNNGVAIKGVYAKGGSKPSPTVAFKTGRLTRETLKLGTDYTISYKNNGKSGKIADFAPNKVPTMTITLKGNYKGKIMKTYDIGEQDLKHITMSAVDKQWSNKAGNYVSVPVLTDIDGKKLSAGKDYDKQIQYFLDGELLDKNDKLNPGDEIIVKVSALPGSGYYGEKETTYRITQKMINKVKFTVEPKDYTGENITIEEKDIVGMDGKMQLVPGKDFQILNNTYNNNRNKGTATVTVKGIGEYGGTTTIKFTIGSKGLLWWFRNLF